VDDELIARAGGGARHAHGVPPVLERDHRLHPAVAREPHVDPVRRGSPQAEGDPAVRPERGAERHLVDAPHRARVYAAAISLATVWSSTSTSTGLATCALKPEPSALARSSGVANPLTATIGASMPCARSRFRSPYPSVSGIERSLRMAS